jgi:hypothetical protein
MKVANVNTTSIRDGVTLGCRTMSNIFNADDHDIPFFGSSVRPEASFGFHPFHSEAHIPGRHLNALLNAEDALGVHVDELVIQKHEKAAFFSYSGPVALPLNRNEIGGSLVNFAPHNIREGFHALYALVTFRGSSRAHDMAEASIAAIFDLWDPKHGWNRTRLEGALGLKVIDFDSPFIGGLARAIGPLVKYHRITGSPPALRLATLLKDKALGEYFPADGECDLSRLGTHTHSITCVLSSLAQLAQATRDAALIGRVKAFYDNGLRRISNDLGWSPENAGPNANPDRGEANNTGDILETALILGRGGIPNIITTRNAFCAAICCRASCVMCHSLSSLPIETALMRNETWRRDTSARSGFRRLMGITRSVWTRSASIWTSSAARSAPSVKHSGKSHGLISIFTGSISCLITRPKCFRFSRPTQTARFKSR